MKKLKIEVTTTDGKIFDNIEEAEEHQTDLDILSVQNVLNSSFKNFGSEAQIKAMSREISETLYYDWLN